MKVYRNKQKNFSQFAIYAILAIFNFSCENTIDLEIPEKPPKLVVGGFFNTDCTMVMRIIKTKYILSPIEFNDLPTFEVNDATIELYQNERFLEVLKHQYREYPRGSFPSKYSVYTTNNFIASEGNLYTIKVSAPGFESVEASTDVPSKILLRDFKVNPVPVSLPDEEGTGLLAEISFQDPPGEKNFYALEVRLEVISTDGRVIQTINVPIFSQQEQKIRFSASDRPTNLEIHLNDASFDGRLYTHQFTIFRNFSGPREVRLKATLKHINKLHYDYSTTAALQVTENKDNPFSLPVQVRTNVKNGLGIFAGYNESSKSKTITLPQ